MPNWNPNDIRNQFKRAQDSGWIAYFEKAARDYNFPPELLMAIASRETNMRNIVGDGGHGYGMMQIDDRSFPDWCESGQWQDVAQAIDKGAEVLDSKRQAIIDGQGRPLKVGKTAFTGKADLTEDEITHTAVAAYNSGLRAFYELTANDDPDGHTTGRDYSSDTYARMEVFRGLLNA